MDWFENGWGLSLIVFLPVVGALAVLAIPKAKESADQVDRPCLLTGHVGIGDRAGGAVRLFGCRHVSVWYGARHDVDLSDQRTLPHCCGRHLTADGGACRLHHGAWSSSTPGTTGPSRTTRSSSWRSCSSSRPV